MLWWNNDDWAYTNTQNGGYSTPGRVDINAKITHSYVNLILLDPKKVAYSWLRGQYDLKLRVEGKKESLGRSPQWRSAKAQNNNKKTESGFLNQADLQKAIFIARLSKCLSFTKLQSVLPGLSNKRFRLWFATLSQSNLIR